MALRGLVLRFGLVAAFFGNMAIAGPDSGNRSSVYAISFLDACYSSLKQADRNELLEPAQLDALKKIYESLKVVEGVVLGDVVFVDRISSGGGKYRFESGINSWAVDGGAVGQEVLLATVVLRTGAKPIAFVERRQWFDRASSLDREIMALHILLQMGNIDDDNYQVSARLSKP